MADSPPATEVGSLENAAGSPPAQAGAPEPRYHPISPAALAAFVGRLGHDFANPDLLGESLTHRSWCAEHAGYPSNERLEFLGDAVLGLVVTDDIYTLLPEAGEGQLSRVRAAVVCASALAEMAADLQLGEVLLLGKGEDASGGRNRPSILADAMEAVIGAVFLDGGVGAASELVGRIVAPRLVTAGAPDHKSRLHELAARDPRRQVGFEHTEHGPEHDKTFCAVVILDGVAMGRGFGRSKKQAEQAAARQTWQQLEHEHGELPPREENTHG